MDLLDSTIAQTAAPAIRRDLGGSFATLEWISAGYTLAMSVTLLLGSRLGDVVGRRRALLAGIVGFAGTSALCAFAPDPETLIVARVLQGACAAVMVPQCFGLIRELFGAEGQAKALGIVGPVMGLGAVLGPLAGGGLIDLNLLGSGWRAIFLINVPIAVVAIAVGRRHLPARRAERARRAAGRAERRAVDGRRLRPGLPADRRSRARLAGLVVRAARRRARCRSPASSAASTPPRAAGARRSSIRRSCTGAHTSPGWPRCSASSRRWAG